MSFLTTEEDKTASNIEEKQRETLSQKLNGLDNLDLSDSKTLQVVVEAAESISDFEEKAFVEKAVPLKCLEICSPTKAKPTTFYSGFTSKSLTEKLIRTNSARKTSSMEEAKTLMTNKGPNGNGDSEPKKTNLGCIVEEDHQVEPVEDSQPEEEIIFRPVVQEPCCSSSSNPQGLWNIVSEKKETIASLAEGNRISNIKKKAKKNKKRLELKETEDDMLERLIKENRKDTELMVADLISVDAPAKKDPKAEERQKAVLAFINKPIENLVEKESIEKQKELEEETFQNLLAKKIANLETMPFAEMISKVDHTGTFVMQTIDTAVDFFVKDIKNVMRRGMKPEHIENLLFDKFKENVIIPDPDEDPKLTKERSTLVHDFMWRYTRKYMDEDTDYNKIRSITYLQLFSQMHDDETVIIPTIEVLAKMEGDPEFDSKEEAILRTVLGQYFTELDCVKRKI